MVKCEWFDGNITYWMIKPKIDSSNWIRAGPYCAENKYNPCTCISNNTIPNEYDCNPQSPAYSQPGTVSCSFIVH